MKKIKIQQLTKENFYPYGTYENFLEPTGQNLGSFYHDHIIFPVSGQVPVGFSPMLIKKADSMIVTAMEYHNYTGEILLPLDDAIVIYAAKASNSEKPENMEAFIVPAGTMINYNIGVWHCGPFAVNKETAHAMVALPQRLYHNDCTVVKLEESEQVELEFQIAGGVML